jgi:anti-sigma regulatory factor (Ser/Thr protein kinase)
MTADLAVLVTEVVSNAVRHASNDPGDEIVVRLFADTGIRVEVLDPGPGFERFEPLQPGEESSSGWGLYLLDSIASAWGIERGSSGTTVWFELGPSAAT